MLRAMTAIETVIDVIVAGMPYLDLRKLLCRTLGIPKTFDVTYRRNPTYPLNVSIYVGKIRRAKNAGRIWGITEHIPGEYGPDSSIYGP